MRPKSLISEAEMKIMLLLWDKSPRTMPEITAILGWGKHMVMVLLKRMIEKGTVRMEEVKPARQYYPLIAKETVEMEQANKLLDELFDGRVTSLVNTFVKQGNLSEADIDELMEYLKKIKAEEQI